MTVAELQKAKANGCPVILKANPPRTYADSKYRRVVAVVGRKIGGKVKPVAILEDYCGRTLVYADPRHIIKEDKTA